MPFRKKFAAAADPDQDAALDSGAALTSGPPASLGAAASPSKKAFGGARALTAGGGGGSKFGGFRKGGGVANFKGGEALMPPFAKTIAPTTPVSADLGGPPASGVASTATKPMYSKKKPSKSGHFGKPAGLTGGKR